MLTSEEEALQYIYAYEKDVVEAGSLTVVEVETIENEEDEPKGLYLLGENGLGCWMRTKGIEKCSGALVWVKNKFKGSTPIHQHSNTPTRFYPQTLIVSLRVENFGEAIPLNAK